MRQSSAIMGLCTGAAIVYGIIHDQITARVCVEYFTIGHPQIFGTTDPTLLGLGWGISATWWVGFLLGIPLALVSQVGAWPKRTATQLVKPMIVLLTVVGAIAALAGVTGYIAAESGWVWLLQPLASRIPAGRHAAFLADLWAHTASYFAGFLGGLVLCGWVLIQRARAAP